MIQTYQCEGCEASFHGTPEDAFNEGWDTPERFMSHCTCPKCPITCTVWWKVVIEKKEPTEEDVKLIQSYNQLFNQANPEENDHGNSQNP